MSNPELLGGLEVENFEKENAETEKGDVLITKEATLELLREISQNQEMKERAETYANRE